MPGTGELFLAEEGAGATRSGRRIRVSGVDDITAAKFEVDFVRLSRRDVALKAAGKIFRTVGAVRSKGCAVAALCSIANGDAEAYLHVGLRPWDYAAAQLIVEEAGGKLSRLDGGPLELFDGKSGLLASNGVLHEEFLSLVEM